MSKKFAGFSTEGATEVAERGAKKEVRFFLPGIHTVQISAVEEKGAVESDDTWQKLSLLVEAGNKKTYTLICYPTESLEFKGKLDNALRSRLVRFGQALGLDMSLSNIKGALIAMFSDVENLVGRELQVVVGYNNPHLRPNSNGFALFNARGESMGQEFSTREEAQAWAKDNNMRIQGYPEILDYIAADNLKAAVIPTVTKTVKTKAF